MLDFKKIFCFNFAELKEWASWEAWGSCSETCGYGVRRRERECVVVKEGRDCGFGMGSCGQGDDAEVGQCLESLNCEGESRN